MAVENGYDGFISYSRAADRGLAKALQRVPHRLGRPWYRRHALRVLRDGTTLALWQANVASAMRALCDLAGELTADDRAQYIRDVSVPLMCAR